MLNINNLSIYVFSNSKNNYLLKDISFSLDDGDSLGIIGKSGDGKSTLAKAILKMYDKNVCYESGSVYLNNVEINKDSRGKEISLLFQNPNSYLNPLMKVGEQIDEMLIYHFNENKKTAKEKAIEIMKDAGLTNAEELYNYYPYEISSGMQQKICLCIALICKPKVLILDEFSSHLDQKSKYEICQLINSLRDKYHFTLIVISHDFKEVYEMCNKIAVMRKGQMIEFGCRDEIILNPIHPYTIELLYDFLKFYHNAPSYSCPLMEIELLEAPPIKNLSDTHYVRSWYLDERSLKLNLPSNFDTIKELIYETIRN